MAMSAFLQDEELCREKKEAVEDNSVGCLTRLIPMATPLCTARGEATAAVTVTQGCTSESLHTRLKLVTSWGFRLRHPGL